MRGVRVAAGGTRISSEAGAEPPVREGIVMHRSISLASILALIATLSSVAAPPATIEGGVLIDSATRTVTAGPLVVRWSLGNPENITYLSWNGSPNLTGVDMNPLCPAGGPAEFFGNSWGTGDREFFVAPVGSGSAGTWTAVGTNGVDIVSAATGCPGTSGVPVNTKYRFRGDETATARIEVERTFSFGATPFRFLYSATESIFAFRPYMARLSPRWAFSRILYPDHTGTSLVTHDSRECGGGCRQTDWQGTWFAVHDPATGRGMIVRHETSPYSSLLWFDNDDYSDSISASIALVEPEPGTGFTDTVNERETLCFYDRSTWSPSTELPVNCSGPWTGESARIGTALGVATQATYTAMTKVAHVGSYVTWRATVGPDAVGRSVEVWVARRRPDLSWTSFVRTTTRRGDASGVVAYSRRETSAGWLSVRFALDGVLTTAAQARWR
jgi:hypothetical protein